MNENPHTDNFSAYIRSRARAQNLSMTQLAQASKISRQTLYKIMKGDNEAKLSTMISVASVLKMHPLDLLRAFFGYRALPFETMASTKHLYDASSFIEDVTIPDNMRVWVNQSFVKSWKIQNTGKVPWINRCLLCMDEQMQLQFSSEIDLIFKLPTQGRRLLPAQTSIPIPTTLPGQTAQLNVDYTAPSYPGTQISYWKMVDESGEICFPDLEGLSCLVQVIAI
jgi:transcriptional regulator with XRE-family HTH domain